LNGALLNGIFDPDNFEESADTKIVTGNTIVALTEQLVAQFIDYYTKEELNTITSGMLKIVNIDDITIKYDSLNHKIYVHDIYTRSEVDAKIESTYPGLTIDDDLTQILRTDGHIRIRLDTSSSTSSYQFIEVGPNGIQCRHIYDKGAVPSMMLSLANIDGTTITYDETTHMISTAPSVPTYEGILYKTGLALSEYYAQLYCTNISTGKIEAYLSVMNGQITCNRKYDTSLSEILAVSNLDGTTLIYDSTTHKISAVTGTYLQFNNIDGIGNVLNSVHVIYAPGFYILDPTSGESNIYTKDEIDNMENLHYWYTYDSNICTNYIVAPEGIIITENGESNVYTKNETDTLLTGWTSTDGQSQISRNNATINLVRYNTDNTNHRITLNSGGIQCKHSYQTNASMMLNLGNIDGSTIRYDNNTHQLFTAPSSIIQTTSIQNYQESMIGTFCMSDGHQVNDDSPMVKVYQCPFFSDLVAKAIVGIIVGSTQVITHGPVFCRPFELSDPFSLGDILIPYVDGCQVATTEQCAIVISSGMPRVRIMSKDKLTSHGLLTCFIN
jgi:hypothetical protein